MFSIKDLRLSFCSLLLFNFGWAAQLAAQTNSALAAVPESRLAHLRHGVNLSGWFAQVSDPKGLTDDHFKSWVTDDDLALIRKLGFDHVRVGVDPKPSGDPKPMFVPKQAEQIPPERLKLLDQAVERIVKHDLAVIITLQPDDDFKDHLTKDPDSVEQFADFWRGLAGHYVCRAEARCNHELVFFEVLNEPNVSDLYRWSGIQAKLVAAIRESAPQHTIVVTGAQRSNIDGLLFLEPVFDRNVIYSFHYYEPFVFTHQGANWSTNYWHRVKQLSYPSSEQSANAAAGNVPDALNKFYLVRYGLENWNEPRITADIAQVKKWAKDRDVKVICDEFGVHKTAASEDRRLWIEHVRRALEPEIGWTVWDYDGNFGFVKKDERGKVQTDDGVLKALGLQR